jgi:hypothetical protein
MSLIFGPQFVLHTLDTGETTPVLQLLETQSISGNWLLNPEHTNLLSKVRPRICVRINNLKPHTP